MYSTRLKNTDPQKNGSVVSTSISMNCDQKRGFVVYKCDVKWRSVCSTYCKTLVPLLLFHHIAYWNSQNRWKLTLVHFFRERTNFNYTCKRKYRTRAEVANIKPDGIIGWFFLKQKHQCFVDVCNTKMNVQEVEHK